VAEASKEAEPFTVDIPWPEQSSRRTLRRRYLVS
jgi:hypothetical protein